MKRFILIPPRSVVSLTPYPLGGGELPTIPPSTIGKGNKHVPVAAIRRPFNNPSFCPPCPDCRSMSKVHAIAAKATFIRAMAENKKAIVPQPGQDVGIRRSLHW
jgi:hypothetical protein